ncbi:hypothetical protein GNY06_13020 [Elizabethkingia argentiflava]|uniref:Uncharacterized protein n=1 Tax=Elizabethkingia argenteiflava TaxID=2681556 RepID=A0A845Q0P2_9FLAO|nr:hypothetical protein [Elizabethkingia argenteiflava]NAW52257.1 hypothetical protein [Elizabethkingia argenteiflava]
MNQKNQKNQKNYLDQNIQDVINNSKNNKESIIKNLENYKLNTEISPKNYLVTSILIETLKLENDKDILYGSSRRSNAKCESSTIGGLIGGAGAGAWGGPAVCVIGGTFGAIGGALAGWGNNPSC